MSKLLSKRRGGFTLIELMIVVAIIGILAAIAIPNFVRFQLRSKSSEGKTNLAGIRTAQESYFAEYGTYVTAASSPGAALGSAKRAFVNTAGAGMGFDAVGWTPEGQVFFNYSVNVGGGASASDYTADAQADIDADGVNQGWVYARTNDGAASTVGGSITGSMGAWDGAAGTLVNQVGPIDGTSGQSIF